jgi:hypothetical protein
MSISKLLPCVFEAASRHNIDGIPLSIRILKGKDKWIMKAYIGPIEETILENKFFRRVLCTGKYCQLVVMCLQPSEEIGNEVRSEVDQFFRIEGAKPNSF